MTDKEFTIAELEDSMNERLRQFDGKEYDDFQYMRWYEGAIADELSARGIGELILSAYGLWARMKEGPLAMDRRVAEVSVGLDRDKRLSVSSGCGTVSACRVAFEEGYGHMTFAEFRRDLLAEARDCRIKHCEEQLTAARATKEKLREELAALTAIPL